MKIIAKSRGVMDPPTVIVASYIQHRRAGDREMSAKDALQCIA
jgi:hypothetical protein